MNRQLLIIFVKNIKLGKVKTRLAKTIGNQAAFLVYKTLVEVTEKATKNLTVEKRIYFSDAIIDSKWKNDAKFVQYGENLGERMKNAFVDGFKDGYKNIILIGSDLPDISEEIILNGFSELNTNDVVLGPAEDGGYYLIGMSKLNESIFKDKPWSTSNLLKLTLQELKNKQCSFSLLETYNDIDTFKDLEKSEFYKNYPNI